MIDTVAFVAHTSQVSGAEKVLLDLVDEATRRNYRVVVVCPAGPLVDRLPKAVSWQRIPQLGLRGESGIRRWVGAARMVANWAVAAVVLARVGRRRGTQLVCNSAMALPALAAARIPGGVSWLVHDTISGGRQRRIVHMSRSVIRRAVAVSAATACPLQELGLPVVVAHNGVRWPVAALPLEVHRPPTVGMVALLTPWKGHAVLLEAIAAIPDVVVEFAGGSFPGDQDHVDALHARAQHPDLLGRVRFLGHVDVETAFARWDVVISASTSPEAGPLSVLEAMAFGKPVIGTDHGGTTEFLCDGAGVLIPPNDAPRLAEAITRLIGDLALRKSIADNGRKRIAQRHDISVTIGLMLDQLMS